MRDQNRLRLRPLAATLIAALLLPALARAQGIADVAPPALNYPAQAFDAVILRPLGLTAAIIGAALSSIKMLGGNETP